VDHDADGYMMRFVMPYFFIPEIGETVYSLVCRHAARSRVAADSILMSLTSQGSYKPLVAAFSTYISQISEVMPAGHPWRDVNHIIRNYSTLPYFTYFNSREYRQMWEQKLTENEAIGQRKITFGPMNSWCSAVPSHPRYCPRCVEGDLNSLRFTYFRREHQLPMVAVCWLHGDLLLHGCRICGPYPIKRTPFKMPGMCNCRDGSSGLSAYSKLPCNHEDLLWIARQSAFLLTSKPPYQSDFYTGLKVIISQKGFINGSAKWCSTLAEAIKNRFGGELLSWLGITSLHSTGHAADWISRFLTRSLEQGERKSTLNYMLIVGALFDSVESFEKEVLQLMMKAPELFRNPEQVMMSGVDGAAVELQRARLLEFIANKPKAKFSELRDAIQETYDYLLRHDAVWLAANLPKIDYSTRAKKPQNDWKSIDQKKAEELELIFNAAHEEGRRPEWVSGPKALKLIGLQNISRQQADRLPLVHDALKRRLESKQEFLRRLFRWAIQEIEKDGGSITFQTIHQKTELRIDYIRQHNSVLFNIAQEMELAVRRQQSIPEGKNAQLELF